MPAKPLQRLLLLLLICLFTFLTISSGQAKITVENQRQIDLLTEMKRVLHTQGADAFLVRCRQQGWSTPKLFSAWYIARLPNTPDGSKQVEQAKSELGLEFAQQLTAVAKTVREANDTPTLEKFSKTLFEGVEWIGREVGYGNLFLQDRGYDIASVAATKLVADLTYPMEKAEAIMVRFNGQWASAENRRQVLFEESGRTHFAPSPSGDAAKGLTEEWKNGVMLALDRRKIQTQPDLEIFVIDDFGFNQTVGMPETVWAQKAHFMIGEGNFGSVNLINLEALREFRKRYGKFPTKPVKYRKGEGESDIQAAFWELSWENPLGVGAAHIVYEQYITGQLADSGYRAMEARSTSASRFGK